MNPVRDCDQSKVWSTPKSWAAEADKDEKQMNVPTVDKECICMRYFVLALAAGAASGLLPNGR